MATKKAESKGNQKNQSAKGGSRPNAGRKPKPVKEMRDALIKEIGGTGDVPFGEQKDAATFAFKLFEKTMRDDKGADLATRLDCAREILNRVWGKAPQSVKISGDPNEPVNIVIHYADSHAHAAKAASGPATDSQ